MKKHFVNIYWKDDNGNYYAWSGLVTGNEQNGKVYISPSKLFYNLFGFNFTGGTVSWG